MKRSFKFLILFLGLVFVFAVPRGASASPAKAPLREEINGNKILVNESFTLNSGDILNGQIIAYHSEVTIAIDSVVNGQVLLIGGSVQALGTINGNMICIGCSGFVGSTTEINGNLVQVSSELEVSPTAQITGSTDWNNFSNINVSNLTGGFLSAQTTEVSLVSRVLTSVFGVLAISAIGVLVTVLFPKAVNRTASASLYNPGISLGAGCLSMLVWVVGAVILTLTIILIPATLLAVLLLMVALLLGWISLGHEIGRRISAASEQKWPEPVVTGIGLLILSTVSSALGYIPCVGGLLSFLLSMVGLGSAILSRLGTIDYAARQAKVQKIIPETAIQPVMGEIKVVTPPPLPQAPPAEVKPLEVKEKKPVVKKPKPKK